jgi:DNA-binding YbaB/EbfC family protein
MFGKLNEMKAMMEEVKNRLDTITVVGEAESGAVKVYANGNRKINNVSISESLMGSADKEQLEELLTVAINRALEQAEAVSESEMRAAAGGFLPNIPGLI